uniref:Uncharacterized protein n=1 Tax=Steinernema glaseri TaxID=37863 RepID=A0A1I7Y3U1_9BILA
MESNKLNPIFNLTIHLPTNVWALFTHHRAEAQHVTDEKTCGKRSEMDVLEFALNRLPTEIEKCRPREQRKERRSETDRSTFPTSCDARPFVVKVARRVKGEERGCTSITRRLRKPLVPGTTFERSISWDESAIWSQADQRTQSGGRRAVDRITKDFKVDMNSPSWTYLLDIFSVMLSRKEWKTSLFEHKVP